MTLARVSTDGQITVPMEIRRALKVKAGDKLLFSRNAVGEIVIQNTNAIAIQEAQRAVAGSDFLEDDILADVMALRYGEVNHANHD